MAKWRQTQLLEDDKDFAFVYINFEEAYLDASRPVAMAWSRCRQKAEFALGTDAAHVLSLSATSAKIKACDEIKKRRQNLARNQRSTGTQPKSNPLRHPGQGTQQPESDMDKERFKHQLIDIMREGEVFKPGNSQASEKEYGGALERRALRICREAEVPTLHKAVTTAEIP